MEYQKPKLSIIVLSEDDIVRTSFGIKDFEDENTKEDGWL